MNKKWQRWMWAAGVAASLSLGSAASAQSTTFQPFKGLFGPKTTPEKAAEQKTQDANRAMEMQIELAWLSDRATFPYYLEAHVKGSSLEVRGYVPTKVVRDQALNLAKLNSSLTVIDAMKEHSSLAFRSVPRAPDQLKSSVQTALREDFPGLKLTVQCHNDGNVQLSGSVKTFEQKLAVSKALRRLHGCTYVTNNIQASIGDIARQPVQPAITGPKMTPTAVAAPARTPTQASSSDPYESRGVVVVSGEESSKAGSMPGFTQAAGVTAAPGSAPTSPTPKTAQPVASASATQIKKKIESSVPAVHNVTVTFTSKKDVKIECALRSGDDFDAVAGQISSLHELEPYKIDLRIMLPMAEQK